MRADQWLVERGYYLTRARAADAIKRGCIIVDGAPVKKPGQTLHANAEVQVEDTAHSFVARSALKLVSALEAFSLSPADQDCLDIGASTGGFTQVMLERGATRVCALDVGHGQLHPTLRSDARVTSLEGINARNLEVTDLPFQTTFITVDVSFISLNHIVPAISKVAGAGATVVLLFKPQFEVGREHLGKGGLVSNEAAVETAKEAFVEMITTTHAWSMIGSVPSPIKGGDGNQEYLVAARIS